MLQEEHRTLDSLLDEHNILLVDTNTLIPRNNNIQEALYHVKTYHELPEEELRTYNEQLQTTINLLQHPRIYTIMTVANDLRRGMNILQDKQTWLDQGPIDTENQALLHTTTDTQEQLHRTTRNSVMRRTDAKNIRKKSSE